MGNPQQQQSYESIAAMVETNKAALGAALPAHMRADRMARVILSSIRKNEKLQKCTKQSLVACMLQCSALGLEPDNGLGHAYLIPYKQKDGSYECTLQVGYKGLLDLARRSGQISTVQVHVVRAGDVFRWTLGLHPDIMHEPKAPSDADITHVYAVATLRDGGVQFDVMTSDEVEDIRNRRQKAEGGKATPWDTDWPEMAKKTVLKRMAKLLPVSAEMARAVAVDNAAEHADDPQRLAFDPDVMDALPAHIEQPVASERPTIAESAAKQPKAKAEKPAPSDDGVAIVLGMADECKRLGLDYKTPTAGVDWSHVNKLSADKIASVVAILGEMIDGAQGEVRP